MRKIFELMLAEVHRYEGTVNPVAMGFTADTGIDTIVKDYIASEGLKL